MVSSVVLQGRADRKQRLVFVSHVPLNMGTSTFGCLPFKHQRQVIDWKSMTLWDLVLARFYIMGFVVT